LAPPDAAALRRCLDDQVVPRQLGRSCPVRHVDCEPYSAATSYASYVVTAELADGRILQLFLKDYGFSRRPRRHLAARRERELRVYRELLPQAGLGTARHLGAVWDQDAARHWLLLELVEGPVVRDLELEHWISPLAWLGRLHGRFAGAWDETELPPFLERHDGRFFRRKADSALAALFCRSARLARRMTVVRSRYERILPILTAGPRTLVHGAFLPANVIVAPGERERLCVVDWELAGVGSPFYDLAFFCDGFEPPALARMLAAYRGQADAAGLELSDEEGLLHTINCFRLHRVIDLLELAIDKDYPDEGLQRLVSRGESLSAVGA
jgi:hypothetical protein